MFSNLARQLVVRRLHVEALVWAFIAIVTWAASAYFGIFETIVAFSQTHESWHIGATFTVLTFLSTAAFVSSLCQSRQHLRSRREAERDAFIAAREDPLTGLPNRRLFLEMAGQALGQAWEQNGRCSVLFVDLDGFKPVNDNYGHAVGDALLIEVAERLRSCSRGEALVARLGGDEFALLLTSVESELTARETAKRVLRMLGQPFHIGDHSLTVSASIGIARGPESGRRAEDLIHAADMAMYEAKRLGRGTIREFAGSIAGLQHASSAHSQSSPHRSRAA